MWRHSIEQPINPSEQQHPEASFASRRCNLMACVRRSARQIINSNSGVVSTIIKYLMYKNIPNFVYMILLWIPCVVSRFDRKSCVVRPGSIRHVSDGGIAPFDGVAALRLSSGEFSPCREVCRAKTECKVPLG